MWLPIVATLHHIDLDMIECHMTTAISEILRACIIGTSLPIVVLFILDICLPPFRLTRSLWRFFGRGTLPPFAHVGNLFRYDLLGARNDIPEFLEELLDLGVDAVAVISGPWFES